MVGTALRAFAHPHMRPFESSISIEAWVFFCIWWSGGARSHA